MQIYVFWRAATVPWIQRHVPRKYLIWGGIVIWLAFVLGRNLLHDPYTIIWLGMVFLLAVAMLAADIITLFGWLFRKTAPVIRGYALIAGGILIIIAIVQGVRPPVVRDYAVDMPGLPKKLDGLVIVALADTHLGSILGPQWLDERQIQVQAMQPDMIFFLGDTIDRYDPSSVDIFLPGLKKFTAKYGVWAISGNHDRQEDRIAMLRKAGFKVLLNQWTEVQPGLILAGVESPDHHGETINKDPLIDKTLKGKPAKTTILLSHEPLGYVRAASSGVNLMLSGHTHGGQIWPFNYLERIEFPLIAGRYEVDRMTVIVSRGTGSWGPRMRLWYPGEILRITLRSF